MSIFTRRHYTWLAGAIRAADRKIVGGVERNVVREMVDSIADSLEDESVGFDRDIFIENIYSTETRNDRSRN